MKFTHDGIELDLVNKVEKIEQFQTGDSEILFE